MYTLLPPERVVVGCRSVAPAQRYESVVTVVVQLWKTAVDERRSTIRVRHILDEVERLEDETDAVRRAGCCAVEEFTGCLPSSRVAAGGGRTEQTEDVQRVDLPLPDGPRIVATSP